MYTKFCEKNNLDIQLLSSVSGHNILQIIGPNSNILNNEAGKHCVQRISPTERSGRRHTSFVNVFVLPVNRELNFKLNENDLEITAQRGHGSGGQNVNKTASAIRVKHIPTGLSVFINGRDQYRNKEDALDIIRQRVFDYEKSISKLSNDSVKRDQMSLVKIRTYNFIDSRCVNHLNNKKTSKIKDILNGNIELLF